jgi:hypothetical protein
MGGVTIYRKEMRIFANKTILNYERKVIKFIVFIGMHFS